MNLINQPLDFEIDYPDSDGLPMAESDQTRDFLIYGVEALDDYFRDRPDVYVSGNSFIYYRQGVPDAVIAPDVYVVFGVEKKKRRSFKVWEEGGITPGFVMEITSKTTQEKDEQEKPHKYAQLGVLEYFQYDPTGDYLRPPLKGAALVGGQYCPIAPTATGSFVSQVLGLELRLIEGELRFFVPETGEKLLSFAEMNQARIDAEQARTEAEQARIEAIPRLLAMGLSVEQVAIALNLTVAQVIAQQP